MRGARHGDVRGCVSSLRDAHACRALGPRGRQVRFEPVTSVACGHNARSFYGCAAVMCGLGAIAVEPCSIRVPSLPKVTARRFSPQRRTVWLLCRGTLVASLWHWTPVFFATIYYLLGASLCFCLCPSWDVQHVSRGVSAVSKRSLRRLAASCGTALATRFVQRISFRGLVLLLYCMCFYSGSCCSGSCCRWHGSSCIVAAVSGPWIPRPYTYMCHSQRFRCCSQTASL